MLEGCLGEARSMCNLGPAGAGDDVYMPAEDSWLLEDSLSGIEPRGLTVDAGCGGGYITIALLKRGCEVVALDVSEHAARVAASKASPSPQLHVVVCDRLAPFRATRRITLIACNPPYLPDDSPRDPAVDGGPTGSEFSLRLISQAAPFIERGASLVLLASTLGGSGLVLEACGKMGLQVEVLGTRKLFFEELYCYLIKGGKVLSSEANL
jgi:release factor glutamine methyltransferase